MIANIFESLYYKYEGKIFFLVAGKKDDSEYAKYCVDHMQYLKEKYHGNFWFDPKTFFYKVPQLNRAADFFLMPSKFEPGGIVQHESLIPGTPVIAFKTGGLQDSIKEYSFKNPKGNGFVFIFFNENDFQYAVERAIKCFNNKTSYKKLRENSAQSFIDVKIQAKSWKGELCR